MRAHYVFCGPIASGKTRAISSVVGALRGRVPCYGFLERCIHRNNERAGYDVVMDLRGREERFPFVRRKERNAFDGNLFSFDRGTIEAIEREFAEFEPETRDPALLYFDEFGNIEAKGRGLAEAMRTLMRKFEDRGIPYATVFGARSQNLRGLRSEMGELLRVSREERVLRVPLAKGGEEKVVEQILETLKNK